MADYNVKYQEAEDDAKRDMGQLPKFEWPSTESTFCRCGATIPDEDGKCPFCGDEVNDADFESTPPDRTDYGQMNRDIIAGRCDGDGVPL